MADAANRYVQLIEAVFFKHYRKGANFPGLIFRPIAAQLMDGDTIALFEFEETKEGIRVSAEKHYRLVPPDDLSPEESQSYRKRPHNVKRNSDSQRRRLAFVPLHAPCCTEFCSDTFKRSGSMTTPCACYC